MRIVRNNASTTMPTARTILFSARLPAALHRRLAALIKRRPYLSSLRAALVLALSAGLDALEADDREDER